MLSEVQTRPNGPLKATNLVVASAAQRENLHSALKHSASTPALRGGPLSLTLGKRARDERAERDATTDVQQRPVVKRVRISDVTSIRTINSSPETSPKRRARPLVATSPAPPPAPAPRRPMPDISAALPMRARSPTPPSDEFDDEPLGPPSWGLMPVPLLVAPHSAVRTPSALALAPELHNLVEEPEFMSRLSCSSSSDVVHTGKAGCGPSFSAFACLDQVAWRSSGNFSPHPSDDFSSSLRPVQWDSAPTQEESE